MESVADVQRNVPSWDSILEMIYETHQIIRESVELHNAEREEYERRSREFDERHYAELEEYERRNREIDERRRIGEEKQWKNSVYEVGFKRRKARKNKKLRIENG